MSGDSVLALASPVGKRMATVPWPLLSASDRGRSSRIVARIPARIGSSGITLLGGDHAFAPFAPGYWAALYRPGDWSMPATIAMSTNGGRSWQAITAPKEYEEFDRALAMAVTASRLVLGASFCPPAAGCGSGIFTHPLSSTGSTVDGLRHASRLSRLRRGDPRPRHRPAASPDQVLRLRHGLPATIAGVAMGARRIAGSPVRDLVLTSRDGTGTWSALSLPNLPRLISSVVPLPALASSARPPPPPC